MKTWVRAAAAIAATLVILPATTGRAQPVGGRSVSWHRCADDHAARCGRLTVPRDWRHPDRATYRIAVRRLPATGPALGPLVVNLGGPGLGGADALAALAGNRSLRRHFDLISFDPRGVGASQPHLRSCPAVVAGGYEPETGPFTWRAVARQAVRQRSVAGRRCHARNRAVGATLGTWQVAHDMDALRSAVGSRRLTYAGYSYGTTLGRVYAQVFPRRLRAMVLDGVTSPVPTFANLLVSSRHGGVAAWRWVRQRLSAAAVTAYHRVSATLQQRTAGDGQDRWAFWGGLDQQLGQGASAPATVTADICGYAAALTVPCAGSSATAISGSPIVTLVDCVDRSGRPGSQAIGRALRGVGPVAAQNVLRFATLCSGVPEPRRPLRVAHDIRLRTPPLLVNGVGDQNTPLYSARRTAAAFPGSRLVRVDTTTHGIFGLAGSRCVDTVATRYLVHRRLPQPGKMCPTPGGAP